MKTEFEKQLNQLLGVRKERTLLMTDDRYNELVAETKEANERRRRGLELSGIHYRRLKRFDVMMIGDRERLIQKNEKGQGSDKIHFCMASEMFDVVHSAHLKIGHKKEKGMELELKRKYCNITREVIAIYLSLCEDCALKKKNKAKSVGAKTRGVSQLTSSCQIDIVDMEAEPDGMHKFILIYQDQQTKFLILRPLRTKTPEEVADILFDIFCLIGVPHTLLCGNEDDYSCKILHSLSENWNVKLVRGEPQADFQSRVSQDILKSLTECMSDNQTRTWASSLRIIQSLKNRCFHPLIQRTPHEALFGHPLKTELTDSSLNNNLGLQMQTEKEVKEQIVLLKQKLDEVNEITKEMIKNLEAPAQVELVEDSQDSEIKCLTCNKSLNPEVFCWKCNGPLHFNCALTTDNSENPFCQPCASKTAVQQNHRRGRKRRMEIPSDQVAQKKSPAFTVGDKVMVSISETDNDNPADRKIFIGTKNAILERLFHRNEFHISSSISKAVSPPIESKKYEKTANSLKSDKSKRSSTKKQPKRHSKFTQCNL